MNLIDIESLNIKEIEDIVSLASQFRSDLGGFNQEPIYEDKKAALLFFEPSTRTKSSFQIALMNLGASFIDINPDTSSIVKGESVSDTIETLALMGVHLFIIRHSEPIISDLANQYPDLCFVNAGAGAESHPTQALTDLLTIKEFNREISQMNISIIGHLDHSRVAKSFVELINKLGCKTLRFSGLPELCTNFIDSDFGKFDPDMDSVIKDSDLVMGLRINTNISSVQALRSLSDVTDDQNQAVQRLSSGKRINHAADDAAGLAISDKLQAEIRGTLQAKRNAQDGISMIQVAEGGMQEISNILVRLRELSVQSSSDTLGERERQFTDQEFQALSLEVDRISKSTQFNGRSLLDGSVDDDLDFQIGNRNDDFNDRISFEPTKAIATLEHLGVDDLSVTEKEDAQENLAKIDEAIETISSNRANLGSLQSRLESTVNNLETFQESSMAANSRIRDADVAVESANLARANILSAANTSILAQANSSPATALKLVA